MGNEKFKKLCKTLVVKYVNEHLTDERAYISREQVYIVWLCKVLQNNKALASAPGKGVMYYELTYNGDKDELYVDAYIKRENVCINNPEIKKKKAKNLKTSSPWCSPPCTRATACSFWTQAQATNLKPKFWKAKICLVGSFP